MDANRIDLERRQEMIASGVLAPARRHGAVWHTHAPTLRIDEVGRREAARTIAESRGRNDVPDFDTTADPLTAWLRRRG
jgi:hypothetical protein